MLSNQIAISRDILAFLTSILLFKVIHVMVIIPSEFNLGCKCQLRKKTL